MLEVVECFTHLLIIYWVMEVVWSILIDSFGGLEHLSSLLHGHFH
jgi:hypothetical protein